MLHLPLPLMAIFRPTRALALAHGHIFTVFSRKYSICQTGHSATDNQSFHTFSVALLRCFCASIVPPIAVLVKSIT